MQRKKILIVDDDPFLREMLSEILQARDYTVETETDGEAALKHFNASTDFQLVISDMNMPKMGGMELIKRIRDTKIDVPIIVLSGNNEISTALEALNNGASDYLVKDENIQDTLPVAAEKAMDKKRILDENRQLMVEVTQMNEELKNVASNLTRIGIALSSERNFPRLLEMIITKVRSLTGADAGTLYLIENGKLQFKVVQNDSLGMQMGGETGSAITFPPVELSESNVSGYAALKGETINIPDVYESDLFDFTGPKKADVSTGYRSKSMLVVPMKNHEDDVVGVLQLLNAKHSKTGEVLPFYESAKNLAESVASQAAMAVTNASLVNDMQKLFESFVDVMATAIDEKSPVTGGHIRRVANLTMTLAEVINEQKDGKFKDINFAPAQLYELKIASLMHDIGKVTTPVDIVEKANKLQAIFDRIHFVDMRFRYLIQKTEREALERKLELLEQGAAGDDLQTLNRQAKAQIEKLSEIRAFVATCNSPGEFLDDDKVARLQAIGELTYIDDEGKETPYLTENELENLSIRRGSITEKERRVMQHHAAVTIKMLNKIPFTKKLRNIPHFAGAHHEFVNGKGYPLGLKGDEIPFEGLLMAVTDIAEALTASDRPYKKAMPMSAVQRILKAMAQNDELDRDLVELFINENVYGRYKERYEAPPADG